LKGLPAGSKPTAIAALSASQKTLTQAESNQVIEFDSSQTYFKQGQIGAKR